MSLIDRFDMKSWEFSQTVSCTGVVQAVHRLVNKSKHRRSIYRVHFLLHCLAF